MGGFANFGGYDDGATSDGYGSGLFDSTVDYSGAEYIDDGASGTVDPGSPIQLDYTDGETDAGIYDQSIWGSDFAQSYSGQPIGAAGSRVVGAAGGAGVTAPVYGRPVQTSISKSNMTLILVVA